MKNYNVYFDHLKNLPQNDFTASESDVESELERNLERALLSDSDCSSESDDYSDLEREMEKQFEESDSPSSFTEDSEEESKRPTSFLRVPTSRLTDSSEEEDDEESVHKIIKRKRKNRREGEENQIKKWKYEKDMQEKIMYIENELSTVNDMLRSMKRDFESFAREDRVKQAHEFDFMDFLESLM